MTEIKKGRQTPTLSVVLPYFATKGEEAIKVYNKTKKEAQPWQELMLNDIMAVNDDGLWTHMRFGYSVPRRNGKSEILIPREIWGLLYGEKILHTAHRTTTSHRSWERLGEALSELGLIEGKDYITHKQFGLESIDIPARNGRISFRTRSSKGGLGEGFDLLVIDEAQEYTDDQESALKYVVSDSENPQTIFCGTPPTTVSAGTVFVKYRKNVLHGKLEECGWAEWSVEKESDIHDKELWYECNPALGYQLSERKVAQEVGEDKVDFNVQRLGLWISYNQQSAISRDEWQELQVKKLPKLQKSLYVGVKYGRDGTNVSLSVAVKTNNNKIFVECIDCQSVRNGNNWLVDYLINMKPKKIIIDGANGQDILEKELKQYKIKNIVKPTVKEVIVANSKFEQAIYNKNIMHMGQLSLEQVVSNCSKRNIGSSGGFGYSSIRADMDISILDSVILAHWACSEAKEYRKQRISC